ncbi:hypothetical protein HNR21_003103 [Actinomadura cellulosilytica]|uniref:Uncharacterized protein n=1 Tax=Thermomonospora cellulosilytica TaxID=1411118 RepID=A0A7W3MYH3_9ACTN|nr:hypothetical protein [Thermomonospora cellulosilytica]
MASDGHLVFVTPEDPAGRAEQNWIAHADLASHGLAGQAEQLWLCAHGDGTYALACIPFCVYGLALHDRVHLSEDGGAQNSGAEHVVPGVPAGRERLTHLRELCGVERGGGSRRERGVVGQREAVRLKRYLDHA